MSVSALSSPLSQVYTPQRRRHYTPQTPSPLRTSRNANLMPPPPTPSSTLKQNTETTSSPLSAENSNLTFNTRSSSEKHLFTTNATFQFQARSRSQSPQASLAKSNALAKTRRSGLFHDKVRQKRDDARFETRGEQVLRMEYIKERRAWEERLNRRAPIQTEPEDSGMDDMDQEMDFREQARHDENNMPSPPEDRELEELLSFLDSDEQQAPEWPRTGGGRPCDQIVQDQPQAQDAMSEDDGYDELFMGVIGGGLGWSQEATPDLQTLQPPQEDQGSSMDLS